MGVRDFLTFFPARAHPSTDLHA